MSRFSTRLIVMLTPEEFANLKEAAEERDMSVGNLVRHVLGLEPRQKSEEPAK